MALERRERHQKEEQNMPYALPDKSPGFRVFIPRREGDDAQQHENDGDHYAVFRVPVYCPPFRIRFFQYLIFFDEYHFTGAHPGIRAGNAGPAVSPVVDAVIDEPAAQIYLVAFFSSHDKAVYFCVIGKKVVVGQAVIPELAPFAVRNSGLCPYIHVKACAPERKLFIDLRLYVAAPYHADILHVDEVAPAFVVDVPPRGAVMIGRDHSALLIIGDRHDLVRFVLSCDAERDGGCGRLDRVLVKPGKHFFFIRKPAFRERRKEKKQDAYEKHEFVDASAESEHKLILNHSFLKVNCRIKRGLPLWKGGILLYVKLR
jgi:hypothetical protein